MTTSRPRNVRAIGLAILLLIGAAVLIARERRVSFLRAGLRLNAYVSVADDSVTVVDLVKLAATSRIRIGPGLSGMREHPTRAEVWGVSSLGGYAWVLDTHRNQVKTRIPVGPLAYAIDFSGDGSKAYIGVSGNDSVLAIDCESHAIIARARTGREPVLARASPDGRTVLVVNRAEATLGIHNAKSLALQTKVRVAPQPEDVAVLPDSSVAFVLSRKEPRLSVVDLRRGLLLTNLELAGRPSEMVLKPDGGELYVISPEAHGLQVINTWTHEVGDYIMLGSAPTHGVLFPEIGALFVSDTAAGRVTPVDITNRKVSRPIPAGSAPTVLRFDSGDSERKPSLLLALDQSSGELAVIGLRGENPSLLTMIPVGDRPQELAVKLF
jgi:DNA-binding beta-propeller fold protein YncE